MDAVRDRQCEQPALGLNFGRSINQTTNIYTNTEGLSQYYNLTCQYYPFQLVSLYDGQQNPINYSYEAQVVNIDKIKNDVTLNVAAGYLSALLAKQQVTLAKTKLQLTSEQLENTRRLVDAGSVPELNAAELEVQFATDTAAVITAQETYDIDKLQLKAILNLDAAAPFDLDTPPVETIPVEPITSASARYCLCHCDRNFSPAENERSAHQLLQKRMWIITEEDYIRHFLLMVHWEIIFLMTCDM